MGVGGGRTRKGHELEEQEEQQETLEAMGGWGQSGWMRAGGGGL